MISATNNCMYMSQEIIALEELAYLFVGALALKAAVTESGAN
jgi:hypothetical protein